MTVRKKTLLFITFFIISVVLVGSFWVMAESVSAAEVKQLGGLKDTAGGIGYDATQETKKIPTYIGNIIGAALAFIGVIFMVLIWMGAFDLVGAGDNEETVNKAKSKIKNGVIGIAIIFASYLFVKVVLSIVSGGIGEDLFGGDGVFKI